MTAVVCRAGFALVLLAAGLSPARADSVEEWLVRMDHAVASISYRGTLVSVGNNRIDTLRVLHRVDERGVRERIYALDGPQREVLRDHDRVRCLISGQSSVVVDNPFPTRILPRIPLDEILGEDSVYAVGKVGSGRVAAREAVIIEIAPRDAYRYGRRLWLDKGTGMLLRSVLYDEAGDVVEQLSFVEIELGASIADHELASDLDNPEQVARYRETDGVLPPDVAASRAPSWLPESLPAGFRLATVGRGKARDGGGMYEHLLFSDGLSSFSVYIEPAGSAAIAEQLESRGATHIYTGSIEGRMVTVVGEVPAPTVRLIGRHMHRQEHPVLRYLE
ncbi:MAG: MucB/RseB C-terminal domain-containing protein [Wenzhouxiangellaceae bacterium]|nr:MucB/RseB C-terminal domain-containing protein [Wenzhouxiangellaceae bacterium]